MSKGTVSRTAPSSGGYLDREAASPRSVFENQLAVFRSSPIPGLRERLEQLLSLERVVRRRAAELLEAVSRDFGSRSRHETAVTEIHAVLSHLRYTRRNLRHWMRPRPRHVEPLYRPGRAYVLQQPKGVVGLITPWNYPLNISLISLTAALAAGNCVVLKPSERVPATAGLLKALVQESLAGSRAAVVLGGAEAGEELARLPLGHLFFTGSQATGRRVAQAAAGNLTPLTLELGGKSPALIHPDFPVRRAARRLAQGKFLNAGQTCVAPDYVLCPASRLEDLLEALAGEIRSMYPRVFENPDYTALIDDAQFHRVASCLEEALRRGARIVEHPEAQGSLGGSLLDKTANKRKIAPTLVVLPPIGEGKGADLALMREEVFGPVLPILPYGEVEEALAFVLERPEPLAFYYFDLDGRRSRSLAGSVRAGGLCLNDTLWQAAVNDLPFGGRGASGLGRYHGREGFDTFSNPTPVFTRGRLRPADLFRPPYGWLAGRVAGLLVGGLRLGGRGQGAAIGPADKEGSQGIQVQ